MAIKLIIGILVVLIAMLLFDNYTLRTRIKQVNQIDSIIHNSILNARTLELVSRYHESVSVLSGEAKRHQVYARLIKDFPAIDKLYLSASIDNVLLTLRKKEILKS